MYLLLACMARIIREGDGERVRREKRGGGVLTSLAPAPLPQLRWQHRLINCLQIVELLPEDV